ncbi:MAG: hypothetical protein ACK5N0_11285 [Synechococcaceae cyanobacterium]
MDRHERGSPGSDSRTPEQPGSQWARRSELEHYTLIQASFSAALAAWQQHWRAITEESLAALASHGIAISFRQSTCGGYVATLLHRDGGGIDSGLCPSLVEARRIVLGHGLEDSP